MNLPIGVTPKSKQWFVMWCNYCEAKYVYGTTGRCPTCLSDGMYWEDFPSFIPEDLES